MFEMGSTIALILECPPDYEFKFKEGQKLRMGEWISAAPIGYLHINNGSKHDRGKNEIVIDKMRAPLIRRLFEEYATGAYTLSLTLRKRIIFS